VLVRAVGFRASYTDAGVFCVRMRYSFDACRMSCLSGQHPATQAPDQVPGWISSHIET
jgi:hypothetical protein